MIPQHPTGDSEALHEEAADWIVRLNDTGFDPDEPLHDPLARNEAFFKWVCRSKHHYAAFLRVYEVHQALEHLRNKQEDILVLLAKARDELANECRPSPQGAQCSRTRRVYRFAAAAVVLLVAGYSASLYLKSAGAGEYFSTGVGEVKQFTLADGTRVVLDTDSRMQVRLTRNAREVNVTRGSAFFTVVHDKTRPFMTCAGDVLLQDVGTEYEVQASAMGARVTVTSGEVKIVGMCGSRERSTGISAEHTLLANQKATIDVSAPGSMSIETEALTAHQVDAALSWRRGVLIFDDVPLSDALRRLNRYLPRKLVLEEPAGSDIRLGGTITLSIREESLLSVLKDMYSIIPDPKKTTPAEIVLVPAPGQRLGEPYLNPGAAGPRR